MSTITQTLAHVVNEENLFVSSGAKVAINHFESEFTRRARFNLVFAVSAFSRRVITSASVATALCVAPALVSAASTCPFDTGGSDAVNDGAVLTRYALGITGVPMTASTRYASLDPLQVKNNIECVGCALDMNGDGMIDAVDTTIIARHLAGFQGASLTAGLALGAGSRSSTAAVTSFLVNGCTVGGAINAFVNGGNAFGAPALLGTTDAQSLTLKSGGTSINALVSTGSGLRVLDSSAITTLSSVNIVNGDVSNLASAGTALGTIAGGGSQSLFCGSGGASTCRNKVDGLGGTVSGGLGNLAQTYAVVGGGLSNSATSDGATVSGGRGNLTTGQGAAIGGGDGNIAGGFDAVVSGGRINVATGNYSVIPGGRNNGASGEYSFAAGQNTSAFDASSFVWGARTGTTYSNGPGSFTVSVPGDILFSATNTPGIGCSLTLAGWHCTSDRATKQSIRDINVRDVLKRVVNLAVPSWEFIGATDNRHIGPMAQDFKKAFGLGDNDKTISAMDMGGVALAAIQGLNEKLVAALKDKDAELKAMKHELAAIKRKLGM